MPQVRTDCQSLLSAAMAGTTAAGGADKVLGRIWREIADIICEDVSTMVTSGKLVWMPAHQSRNNVGQAVLSNGVRLSPSDWRANRLVDILAKRAAAFHQLTPEAINTLTNAATISQWALAQLARVTHHANNHEVTMVDEQGVSSTKIARDSMERPKFAKSKTTRKRKAPKMHILRDISNVAPWVPQPALGERERATKVRRCATIQRAKAATQQVASAVARMGSSLKQTSTFEQSDAKRARLLEKVRGLQRREPATA
jgi:hypothetical protein